MKYIAIILLAITVMLPNPVPLTEEQAPLSTNQYSVSSKLEVPELQPESELPLIGDWQARCIAWASQAGITLDTWAIELIRRESMCNPSVMNFEGSGACGIAQALPCSKLPCELTELDAPCQIKWMYDYVMRRYGSWQRAVAFHDQRNWY